MPFKRPLSILPLFLKTESETWMRTFRFLFLNLCKKLKINDLT